MRQFRWVIVMYRTRIERMMKLRPQAAAGYSFKVNTTLAFFCSLEVMETR